MIQNLHKRNNFFVIVRPKGLIQKSLIRETKHLSTDADSSTNAIGGWTKNTPKPDFFEKRKNSFKGGRLECHCKYIEQKGLSFFSTSNEPTGVFLLP